MGTAYKQLYHYKKDDYVSRGINTCAIKRYI
jgi:hypothetical protein